MSVPRTTITNNAAAVEKLLEQGRVVFKTMSPLMVSGCPMFISDEITKEFLSESQTGIARCPSLYQEVVKRGSELRIFVVNQMVSAVRIASQALDEKKIDGYSNSKPKQVFTKVQVQLNIFFYFKFNRNSLRVDETFAVARKLVFLTRMPEKDGKGRSLR